MNKNGKKLFWLSVALGLAVVIILQLAIQVYKNPDVLIVMKPIWILVILCAIPFYIVKELRRTVDNNDVVEK